MTDHRQQYSVLQLLINGRRMTSDYAEDDAVEDYLRLHPDADREAVRSELERELVKAG